ncbi:MAG: hypothetical protein ABIV47_05010 [Roseiflexaceae bacterium]
MNATISGDGSVALNTRIAFKYSVPQRRQIDRRKSLKVVARSVLLKRVRISDDRGGHLGARNAGNGSTPPSICLTAAQNGQPFRFPNHVGYAFFQPSRLL